MQKVWRRLIYGIYVFQARFSKHILKFGLWAALGLLLFTGITGVLAQSVTTPPIIRSQATAQVLLKEGIQRYEAQQFTQAISLWQQATSQLSSINEPLQLALVYSNLSAAYQELGEWDTAEAELNHSLRILAQAETHTQSEPYWDISAKAHNTQGGLFWSQGRLEEALTTWKQATTYYTQADNQNGVIGSLLNQARALQSLGLSRQAQTTLEQVNQRLVQLSDPGLRAVGSRRLGEALRHVGQLDESQALLTQSLELSSNPQLQADTLLELGNTERALGEQAIAIGKPNTARTYRQTAIQHYQRAAQLGPALTPQLNQLSLLVETGQTNAARQLWETISPQLDNLTVSRMAVNTRINSAHSLACLRQQTVTGQQHCLHAGLPSASPAPPPGIGIATDLPSWSEIRQSLEIAIQQSQQLKDPRALSYALGELGWVYEWTGQWPEAQALTQQAILALEKSQAPDIRYRWEWQLGRLLEHQGQHQAALQAYEEAATTLKSVRSDLLTINSEVQFSFRDHAEPLYREFVSLLLHPAPGTQPSPEFLNQALQQVDALQLAELENFLGCNLTAQRNQKLGRVGNDTAFIHPILLPEHLDVIYQLPGQALGHYEQPMAQAIVEETIENLQTALLERDVSQVRKASGLLYRWLLEPLESDLEQNPSIKRLVFTLDGDLRNIPMAVLYDTKTQAYLIEKDYALALLPSSQAFDLQPQTQRLKILGAGISEELDIEDRNFSSLNTPKELEAIRQLVDSKIFLNREFTQANLEKALGSGDYSVLHLATHGQFSSDPSETYIVAYDDQQFQGTLIRPSNFDQLLHQSSQPIDLLTLSACETAAGDHRATLGLAGLALRSGAKSTLATLWQVSDNSTIDLMELFYDKLSQPGISKAEALHLAQQALLKTPNSQNPYYWAPYVLVGNWH